MEPAEEGELGPSRGNKQARPTQERRGRRAHSVESREEQPATKFVVADEPGPLAAPRGFLQNGTSYSVALVQAWPAYGPLMGLTPPPRQAPPASSSSDPDSV